MKLWLHLLDDPDAAPTGPLLPREGAEWLLGRDADCDLTLAGRSVSRHHAALRWHEGIWRLRDLDSRFGTRLNDEELKGEQTLAAGDRIQLGKIGLILRDASGESATAPVPEERRYRVLLDILELLAGERSLDEILAAVIRLAGEAGGADRGFILLHDGESGCWRPETAAAWRAPSLGEEDAPAFDEAAMGAVSQTVLKEALESRGSVFLRAAAADPRFAAAESLLAQQVHSLLCVPLLGGDGPLGAFYVDRRHAGSGPFSDDDRELLETVAAQAARVIEKEQLERARSRAEKLALLGTMVGRITHELKNPLYNIRGTAENIVDRLAGEGLSEEELRKRMGRILAGLDKAETRMRSLLRFARPGGGAREAVDLGRLLTAAAVETAPRFRAAGVELIRDYPRGLIVRADREALEQVFANLLLNAVQALEDAGGGKVTLSAHFLTRLGEAPDWAEVRVIDNGPGIPAEHLERIFEDFFTTRSGSGGSGLGLAICRHIVEEHHGELTASNREPGGACFALGLPLLEQRS
jgi:signal transduction histidine kinase